MKIPFVTICSVVAMTVSLVRSSCASDDAVSAALVRSAVEVSLQYVQDKGQWWLKEKKCVSCHRLAFVPWTIQEAERRGFAIDTSERDRWIETTIDASGGKKNVDGLAQLILARDPDTKRDDYVEFAKLIVEDQQDDGSWKPDGQLPSQKRPSKETREVSTMWAALSLDSFDDNSRPSEAIAKAWKFVKGSASAKSTEWYAVRLLFEQQRTDGQAAERWIDELRSNQNSDGGWSWLIGDRSDALATGTVMYSLLRSGIEPGDEAIQRAVRFLIDSQRDDGSWEVYGTKKNKKDRPEETAIYWGTAWATLGLLETLPGSP